MESKIDWSKAPADATHYQAATHGVFECWLKPGHAVRVSRGEPDWREDDYADDLIATSAIKRPWSGEGLPPVGVVCEFKSPSSGGWLKARIIFVSAWTVVLYVFFEHDEHCYSVSAFEKGNLQFRPIRTNEQNAADEREQALQAACDVVGCQVGSIYGVDVVKKLIDAGYRKP